MADNNRNNRNNGNKQQQQQPSKQPEPQQMRYLRDDPMLSFPDVIIKSKSEKSFHLPPQMRFTGIQPGPEWDGVDRGNGFELRVIKERSRLSKR